MGILLNVHVTKKKSLESSQVIYKDSWSFGNLSATTFFGTCQQLNIFGTCQQLNSFGTCQQLNIFESCQQLQMFALFLQMHPRNLKIFILFFLKNHKNAILLRLKIPFMFVCLFVGVWVFVCLFTKCAGSTQYCFLCKKWLRDVTANNS